MTQIQEHLPRKPYCTDDPRAGLLIRPRETALQHNYLQLNPSCLQWAMVFDLDFLTTPWTAQEAHLPEPSYLVINKKNLHSHMIYRLSTPVCTTDAARLAPLRYAAAVETAYQKRLKADPQYIGLIAKNPWKDDYWTVIDNGNLAYDLEYMADFVTLPRQQKRPVREISSLGRNCALFDTVRYWAYSAIRGNWKPEGAELWAQAVYEHCMEANQFINPLGERELRCIARSIAKWTWKRFRPGEFAAWQKRRIEKRWGVRMPQGVAMLVGGASTAEVATALHVHATTARRWRRRALPEEKTVSELKPWESEGISRRTWYRRRQVRQNLAQNEHTISDNSRQAVHKGGTPETQGKALKPWVLEGISRSTWYRRRRAL